MQPHQIQVTEMFTSSFSLSFLTCFSLYLSFFWCAIFHLHFFTLHFLPSSINIVFISWPSSPLFLDTSISLNPLPLLSFFSPCNLLLPSFPPLVFSPFHLLQGHPYTNALIIIALVKLGESGLWVVLVGKKTGKGVVREMWEVVALETKRLWVRDRGIVEQWPGFGCQYNWRVKIEMLWQHPPPLIYSSNPTSHFSPSHSLLLPSLFLILSFSSQCHL